MKQLLSLVILLLLNTVSLFSADLNLDCQSIDMDHEITERNLKILSGDVKANALFQKSREHLHKIELFTPSKNLTTTQVNISLFQRGYTSRIAHDTSISESVYEKINCLRPEHVYFTKEEIYNFNQYGTCSAMALDFLSRYLLWCSDIRDVNLRREIIKSLKVYNGYDNITFKSRQAAYNSISVDKLMHQKNVEEIRKKKIQSLANYHNMDLEAVIPSYNISENNFGPNWLCEQINLLQDGAYVIRAIKPTDNKRMELYGHTLVFVKNKDLSLFYDNHSGATEVGTDFGSYVSNEIINWGIPEVRIYRVVQIAMDETSLSPPHI
jgi:hypothetical protein